MKLITFLGRIIIALALLAFIAATSLFVVGAFVVTWPILRANPKMQKQKAIAYALTSLFALLTAFSPDVADDVEYGEVIRVEDVPVEDEQSHA